MASEAVVCRKCKQLLSQREKKEYGDICTACNDREIGAESRNRMTADEISFYQPGR